MSRDAPSPAEGAGRDPRRPRLDAESTVVLGGHAAFPDLDPERVAELQARAGSHRYVPLAEVARGGMGTVLQVWDTVLRRPLAMKVLAADEGAEGERDPAVRFLREARVTAQLDHPGVVPIHDLEIDEDGHISFTMPLIEGSTLEDVFERMHRGEPDWTDTRAVLQLFKVCEIVAYAHSRGVIHRDLKPSNVMVGKFGEIYVVDWGLAKVVGAGEPQPAPAGALAAAGDDARDTLDGAVFGTPSYMSPEQAEGRVHDVSHRSDVYAIGAMLYHLLTGRKPYTSARGRSDADTILKLVRRGSPTPIARLAPAAPGELIAICERAMARAAEDRYESMQALAEDLRAFLEGRVVMAYERGFLAEARKLVQRNRAVSVAIGSALLVAISAMTIVTYVHTRVNQRLEANNEFLRSARADAEASAARAEAMARVAEARRHEAERRRYVANLVSAATSARSGDLSAARRRLLDAAPDLRGWEWDHLWLVADGSIATWRAGGEDGNEVLAPPLCVAARADRGLVAAGFADGRVQVRRLEDGEVERELEGHAGAVRDAAFSPDGSELATVSQDCGLVLWDLGRGRALRRLGVGEPLRSVAWAPAGDALVAGSVDGGVFACARAGEPRLLVRCDGAISASCFTPDGLAVAVSALDGVVRLVDAATGRVLRLLEGHENGATAVALDPRGVRLVSGDGRGTVRLWDVASGELLDVWKEHTRAVTALFFDPGSGRIVSGSLDGALRARSRDSSAAIIFRGHTEGVADVCATEDGNLVLSASWDRTIRTWDGKGPADATRFALPGLRLRCGTFSPDGARIALGAMDGHALWIEARTGRLLSFAPSGAALTALCFLDQQRLAAATLDADLLVWGDGPARGPRRLRGHADAVLALVAANGRPISASADGTIRVWDVERGEEERILVGHEGPVVALAVDATRGLLASASADGTIRIWSLVDGEPRGRIDCDTTPRALAFHPEGGALAWGDDRGRVELAELDSGLARSLGSHEGAVHALAWSPSATRLASASADGSVRVWDVELEELLIEDHRHADEVLDLEFDATGRRLLTVSASDGLIVLESGGASDRLRARLDEAERGARVWSRVSDLLAGAPPSITALRGALDQAVADPGERRLAEELAAARVFRAERLRGDSWRDVLRADAAPEEHQSALERVREAALLAPDDPAVELVLGAALVRNGLCSQALEHLQQRTGELDLGDQLAALAFLGLATCALGHAGEASSLLARLRDELPALEVVERGELSPLIEELEACLQEEERR